MNWLTSFSVRNIAAVLILALIVSAGGIYTATQLQMETMPDINFPVIVAITPYPGASPEEIDEQVSQPIEKAIHGLKGIQKIDSISADSTSVVVIQYDFDSDLDKAQQAIKDAVSQVHLPEQALSTTFNRFGFNTYPVLNLSVTSDKKNVAQIERWVNDTAKGEIESVNGVGEVQVKGAGPKAVYVRLIPEQLKKYNLSIQQVQQALMGGDLSLPVGSLSVGQMDLPVRIEQSITNIEQLRNYQLTVPTNPYTGLNSAFTQIGQGFQQLGKGLGQVGQGVGMLQVQVLLLQQIQQLQAQIIGDQIALNDLLNKVTLHPELAPQIALLQQKIAAEQAGLVQLNTQLKQFQLPFPSGKTQHSTLSNPKVKTTTIQTVKLGDIADITEAPADNLIITRTNGKLSVNIDVIKNPDANVVEVADGVNQAIAKLQKANPDMKITTLFDQSRGVKASVNTMVREGLLGALFAAIVILLFLRNLRLTFISIISIPISILATLILLKQAGVTLNVMTLGGLAVATGRVVDDSIVVIENIYRHLMRTANRNVNVIQLGVKEVASAITSSTLTTVAVFVPLGFVSGIVGKVFMPFALTVVFSLLCSLIVSVTIVPALAKIMLLRGKTFYDETKQNTSAERYRKMLGWALSHKALVLVISILMLVSSLGIINVVGTAFLPSDKDKLMEVNLKMPSGTDLAKTDEVAHQIEAQLHRHPEVNIVSTTVGNLRGKLMIDGSIGSANRASMFVTLKSTTDMETFLAQVRQEVAPLQKEGQISVNEIQKGGPPSSTIQVGIAGGTPTEIRQVADQLTPRIQRVKGLVNVTNNLSAQRELITVTVDNARAAAQGLVPQQVALTIHGLLDADKVIEMGPDKEDVKLGILATDLTTVDALKQVQLLTPSGKLVQLGDVATVKQESGPVTVLKENGQDYATVTGNVIVKDTGAVSRDVQQVIDSMAFPKGITVTIGGDVEQMNDSFRQLGIAMAVAVAAVYIVMIIAFGEATAPFTILFSLPFAIIGGLLGLLFTDQPISVSSMIGALMLIGIVVTNAIVLVDRVQQMRRQGLPVREALLEAAGTRLRPILMTALATICALLPLGLGFGEGTLISQGLAVVVIGGLASSTFLTLFIVPIVYLMLHQLQQRFGGQREITTTAE